MNTPTDWPVINQRLSSRWWLFALVWLLASCHKPTPQNKSDLWVSEAFVQAYNQRDIEQMLTLTHPEIRYMFVSDDQVAVETSGREALAASLNDYFQSLPSSRSVILQSSQSGPFIRQVEQAIWQNKEGKTKSQCSLSVYELEQAKIMNVWYFAAYPCPEQ